nr:rna polymerase ii transcription factor b subunit 4 [Quercus suber]
MTELQAGGLVSMFTAREILYKKTVFPTDLHSRTFLQLPKSVDECFCHKKTIDMGYICSVSLSIFCKHHKKCSTCGSVFGQAQSDVASTSNLKRKTPKT